MVVLTSVSVVFYIYVLASIWPCVLVCFFFFQEEDGIRDLVRSGGRGDVYKRQVTSYPLGSNEVVAISDPGVGPVWPGGLSATVFDFFDTH